MSTRQPVWMREYGDVTFGTSGFAQWNNNLLLLAAESTPEAVQLETGLLDFTVEVLLEDEATGITWPPNSLADMTILAGAQYDQTNSATAPDLKLARGVDLLATTQLTMVQQWEFTNASTGGHARVGLWQNTEPVRFHVKRNVAAGPTLVSVNVGVLPYFANSVATEGFVFGFRGRCYSRTLWDTLV